MDYARVAYCKATKKWTNLGYIPHKKGVFDFHKILLATLEVSLKIHQNPSQTGSSKDGTFKCEPGIGTVNLDGFEWVFLFGYFPNSEIEYLLNRNDRFHVNLRHKKWSLLKST